jgi:hypothetical protein
MTKGSVTGTARLSVGDHVKAFDPKNRPVIRVGVHDVVGEHATVYHFGRHVEKAYIQTLDMAGT